MYSINGKRVPIIVVLLLLIPAVNVVPVTAQAQANSSPAIVLHNSWVQKSHVYEGAIHSHSTKSDGHNTPEEMSQAYRREGFNFTVLTDHDKPPLPSTLASGILTIGGEEVTVADSKDWTSGTHVMHLGAIGIYQYVPIYQYVQDAINSVNKQGGIAVINHPKAVAPYSDETLKSLSNYSLVDNYDQTGDRPEKNAASTLYDNLLTAGNVVWLSRSDDADYIKYVNTSAVMVNADSLTTADIMANLRAGNFYSAVGHAWYSSREMARISSIVTSGPTITITVPQQSTIKWIKKGGVVAKTTANVKSDSYTTRGDEGYVRMEVSRSDNQLIKAWSQPVFVQGSLKVGITITSPLPFVVGRPISLRSSEPGWDSVTYNWSVSSAPSGSTATITADPTKPWVATFVPGAVGNSIIRLNVSDGSLNDFASVTVNVGSPTSLTAATSKTAVLTNEPFIISVSPVTRHGGSGGRIDLQRSTDKWATWSIANTTTADQPGGYQFVRKESVLGEYRYRAVFSGTTTESSSVSLPVRVFVVGVSTLTAITAPTTVYTNQKFNVTGALKANGAWFRWNFITLQRSTNNIKWNTVTTFPNSGSTTYKFTTTETTAGTVYYRTTYAGDATHLNATSNVVKVTVKAHTVKTPTKLTATAPTTATVNKSFSITSKLTANGAALTKRTISLQRFNGKTWTTVASKTSLTGTYSFSRTETTANIYNYRAIYAGDATHLNATSNAVRVTVR